MKTFFKLLFIVFLFTGCDDGDLTVENIDFTTATANICGETLYKLSGNEAIFMKIPAGLSAFSNDVTPTDEPRIIPIGGNVSVSYRAYDGTPSAANICSSPGPISPVATTEWIATSGNIEVKTTAVYSINESTGASKIIRYVHNIVFKNIVFAKPDGDQVYETFPFGDYSTTPTTLPFNFSADDLKLCAGGSVLYNARTNGIEAISIENIDPNLLSTANLGTPKTGLISSSTNKLTYRLFTTALTVSNNEDYFCQAVFPDLPLINELWTARDGVTGESGIIEVISTTNGTGFLHTITLKAVTFQRGNSTFYYGNEILLGNLLTTN